MPKQETRKITWTPEQDALFATLSNPAIAHRLGATLMAVAMRRHLLRKLGTIPPGPTPRKAYVGPDGRTADERWTGVDWSLSDREIAASRGVAPSTAGRARERRRRRGLFAGTASTPRRFIRWTPAMDALLGTAADRAIAGRLDVSRTAVTTRRLALGIPPVKA